MTGCCTFQGSMHHSCLQRIGLCQIDGQVLGAVEAAVWPGLLGPGLWQQRLHFQRLCRAYPPRPQPFESGQHCTMLYLSGLTCSATCSSRTKTAHSNADQCCNGCCRHVMSVQFFSGLCQAKSCPYSSKLIWAYPCCSSRTAESVCRGSDAFWALLSNHVDYCQSVSFYGLLANPVQAHMFDRAVASHRRTPCYFAATSKQRLL